jgi:predicted MFS family arabinose efflux permease
MHADKQRERGLHIIFPVLVGAIGYLLLILLKNKGPAAMYVASIITTTGVFSHIPAMLSWFTNNIGGHTKRGVATAIIISIGNVGKCERIQLEELRTRGGEERKVRL